MDSLLRDLNREQEKMQTDVANLHRHYKNLHGYVQQYLKGAVIEWAGLILDHPKALLVIVETTPIICQKNHSFYAVEHEPIRLTTLSLVGNHIQDWLFAPNTSRDVSGTEYHGLTMADLEGKPLLSDVWSEISEVLEGKHLILFGTDWARNTLTTIIPTTVLDSATCLHNKCKEYYSEFYELSLEKVLAHQGIDKKREQLTDSRERILVLFQVLRNLAAGMPMQAPEPETLDNSDDLDGHPF